MKYESNILKRLIDTYGVIGNPRYLSEIIKEFIVRGKELYPHLFTYQADWLAHIDEFGLTSDYVVSYTGQQIYAPHSKEKPVKRAILKGSTKYRDIDTGEVLDVFEDGRNLELVSVKMPVLKTTGKNLFNFKTEEVFHGWLHNDANLVPDVGSNCMTTDYIQIKENVRYSHNGISMAFYDHNKKAIGKRINTQSIVSPSNAKYMRVTFEFDTVPVDKFQYVIGEWSGYEPYKSNILTVNEDVTLRSNGVICDELNLLTGQLTQRIGEDGVVLSQEVVKTVDLSIEDQDNQTINNLSTFEGGTHFTTSSQVGSLLPTLTVDVVTDLEETLVVCSLEGNTM